MWQKQYPTSVNHSSRTYKEDRKMSYEELYPFYIIKRMCNGHNLSLGEFGSISLSLFACGLVSHFICNHTTKKIYHGTLALFSTTPSGISRGSFHIGPLAESPSQFFIYLTPTVRSRSIEILRDSTLPFIGN